jgi:hypothetical protein
VKALIDDPPDWRAFWSTQVGAELKDGLCETPGYIAFAQKTAAFTTPTS